ncbi:TMV resistance protein N isoform X2 [Prunus persica]|uniref:TMV resistance protein N isoform X2 n=1 Tax=Prunus persica TaxID=3760 RepID=UPI0009AB86DF|nr:TMV resistance protein N isoform X2 [Prunus persica]
MSIHRTFTSFPSSSSQWKYVVFLSFRGDDTRKGFTDHLYTALEHQGITTFRENLELQKGMAISPQLLTAIEESRFTLIVLSRNYASSTWCLDELVKILECMEETKTVLPIFYDVDPSDVRKQTGTVAEAFIKHEERFVDDAKKVRKWRAALKKVANLSGWNSKDWYESKLVKDIAEVLRRELLFSSVENQLVGIDSRLKPINLLLGAGVDDVRFVGIWGVGGIGKTTIAKVVRERISNEFEFSIFIGNVRNIVEKGGLVSLQKQLLSGIWMEKDDISNLHEGAMIIRRVLSQKKVLLILDDVNHLEQLESVAGNHEWFGFGSRVLITTRNEYLLIKHGVKRRFQVKGLKSEDALQLFTWKAFKKDYPEKYYLILSNRIVSYVKGLPLALEVLGSFLHGRVLSEWNSALGKLGVCNLEIFEALKISYDGLDDKEKKMFLDIACFFNGKDKDRVIEACDVSAVVILEVLTERSLVKILGGRLWMHDSLQEMGRQIILWEFPDEPGRCSRLWFREDANRVLSKNTGTEAIEGIVLHPADPGVQVHANAKSFSKMVKLRYLKISNPLHNLKTIKLSHSPNLVSVPNFNGMPNLEVLILEGCTRLFEVDPSIQVLERLTLLNLKDCKNLAHLPSSVGCLKSLKVLNLFGCSRLNILPEELGYIECLEELDVSRTSIRELPSSIGRLKGLTLMNLKDCKYFMHLPTSVNGLKCLKFLNLSGCTRLHELREELGHVECLEKLDVSGTTILLELLASLVREVSNLFLLGKSLT